MSIIKTIESTEQLDQVAYLPFISSRVDLLDFNSKIAYVIHNNLFSVIRKSIKNNIPLDELVVFNEDLLSNKDVQYIVQLYSEAKFYPFSRKEFYASFFSNLIPSLADSVYNHLKATNRIVPIGSGQHKGFIVNPSSFSTDVLPDFSSDVTSFSDILDESKSSLEKLFYYYEESVFYEEAIKIRDAHIQSLYEQIANLQNQISSAYQTTWR
jgi:hypothetical protein